MSDATLSTLEKIIVKIRRITRSPSTNQITDAQIRDYINTFVLYDFPEEIRDSALRRVFTFYAQPYVDTYDTNTTDINSPLYNFKNKYITVHQPAYVAGLIAVYSQSRQQFYNFYPQVNYITSIGTGNGVITHYAGTLINIPMLQRSVLFGSRDVAGNGLSLIDIPVTPLTGNLVVPNNAAVVWGTINYVTGVYAFDFPNAPAVGADISSHSYAYSPAKPSAVLYFENKFVLRPVPDQPYRIDLEAYARPDELLLANVSPELAQWWQFIALGACMKVFEDRMDQESIQLITPAYEAQKDLIIYRIEAKKSDQRIPTIYSEMTSFGPSGSGWGFGGNF